MNVCIFGQLGQEKDVISKVKKEHTIISRADIVTEEQLNSITTAFPNKVRDDIIFFTDSQNQELLKKAGISDAQIINCSAFGNLTFRNPIDGFSDQYNAILMGMSHSECGINERLLQGYSYYKESAPSLDLFLHLKFLQTLCKKHTKVMNGIRRYLFEFPYYVFNYDLSRFGKFALSKLNYFDCVGDYHHLSEQASFVETLRKYELYKAIMHDGVFAPVETVRINDSVIKQIYHSTRNAVDIIRNNDTVWKDIFIDTVNENKGYWNEIVGLIRTYSPSADIVVLVMPFNPLFRVSQKEKIKKQRLIFYKNVENDCIIIDDFQRKMHYSWYDDHCHISKRKADKYTLLLNDRLSII